LYLALFFLYTDPPPPKTHTLSLHDALPILTTMTTDQMTTGQVPGRREVYAAVALADLPMPQRVTFVSDDEGEPYQVRLVFDSVADRKSTRLNSSHRTISYAVFCLKKKNKKK